MADSTEHKQEPAPLTEEQVEALAERFTASWEGIDDSTVAEEAHQLPAAPAQPLGPANFKRTMLGLAPTTQAAIPQRAEPPAPNGDDRASNDELQTAGSIPRQTTLLGIQAPDPSLVEQLAESLSAEQASSIAAPSAPAPAPGYGAGMLGPPPDRGIEPAAVPSKASPEPEVTPQLAAAPQGEPASAIPPAAAPLFASVPVNPVALGPGLSPEPAPLPPAAADVASTPPAPAESQPAVAQVKAWGSAPNAAAAPDTVLPEPVVAPTPQLAQEVTATGAEAAPEHGPAVAEPEAFPVEVPIEVAAVEPAPTPAFPEVTPSVPIEVEIPAEPTATDSLDASWEAASPSPEAAGSSQPPQTEPAPPPATMQATAGAANVSAPRTYAPPSAPPQSAASAMQTEERSIVVEGESAAYPRHEHEEADAAAARLAQHADTIPPERPRLSDLDIPPDFKARSGKKVGLWIGAVLAVSIGIGAAVSLSDGGAPDPATHAEKESAPDLKAAVTTAADAKQAERAQESQPEAAEDAVENTDSAQADAATDAPIEGTEREAAKPRVAPAAARAKKIAAPTAPKQAAAPKPTPAPARKATKPKKPKTKSKTIVRDAPF